jgi:hypothetical protein
LSCPEGVALLVAKRVAAPLKALGGARIACDILSQVIPVILL